MPPRGGNGVRQFENQELVLKVSASIDRNKWDESRFDAFVDELCGSRQYQKDAIFTALRYLLGGKYRDVADLADESFRDSDAIRERYGTRAGMERHLSFPDLLSATLDLATGTGKSYVLYGIATIVLAEGVCDRVLVLCPSTTIEDGLIDKFTDLAGRSDLRDLLPPDSAVLTPRIINASESIVSGSICIENYHAVLAHVRSSIRDSLEGKGPQTLILNDECHHVANATAGEAGKWNKFITDPAFGFRYVVGVSGTCYRGNEYFGDVIYRYSLRQAIEEKFVKKIEYVAEMPRSRRPDDEKWQLVLNRHEHIRKSLRASKLSPLTIIVTKDIRGCREVAETLKAFLVEHTGRTRAQVDAQVLVIYTDSPDLPRLATVDSPASKVEWILSVSMLNEGWDVKRVFQIVPHEKRAFESKLLIAQVLGRGLRIPTGWVGAQPTVTVFNHDSWATDIRHLVSEVMELERRIPTFPLMESPYRFDLVNVEYDPKPYMEKVYPMEGKYKLFAKGYVDLSTEQPVEDIRVEFEQADTGARSEWKTTVRHATYEPRGIAEVMFQRFEDLEDPEDRAYYMNEYPIGALEAVVRRSLKETGNRVITDGMRQKFLQSLGTLQRKAAQVVRYDFDVREFLRVPCESRPQESVSASDLRRNKTLFIAERTASSIPDEARPFFDEIVEPGSGFKCYPITNDYDFKTPLNAVVANHDNERRFIRELISPANLPHIDSWMKSTDIGFYEIDYFWKKGEHPKRGRFSPDFFVNSGDLVLVVEIKDDDEIHDPAPENAKKYEYAIQHFERINAQLRADGEQTIYKFNFLTPSDYGSYFQSIRDASVEAFRSALDVELSA